MRVLLDTQVVLWAAAAPERLGTQRDLIADDGTELLVSAASSWEVAIKHALGKLPLPERPSAYMPSVIRRLAATGLPIQHAHALHVAELPPHHRDPFDRLLIAQAMVLGVPLVTADAALTSYDVELLRP